MQFLSCNQRRVFWKKFFYFEDEWDDEAAYDASVNSASRNGHKKRRKKPKSENGQDESEINQGGRRRTVRTRDMEELEVKAQASANELNKAPVLRSQPQEVSGVAIVQEKEKKNIDERYVWYTNIAIDLNDATRDVGRDEPAEQYMQKKEMALVELRKRIPQVDGLLSRRRVELYWASKALKDGWRDGNRWGSETAALNFLRNEMGIDKKGIDKPRIVMAVEEENEEKKNENKEEPQGELVVIKKEELEKHKNDEYVDPTHWLIMLGDLTGEVGKTSYRLNEGTEHGFSDEVRLSVLRRLVQKEFDMWVFGVQLNIKENGDLEYSADLNKIDRVAVLEMVQELTKQNQKYDEGSFSLVLKTFMNKNLDKFKMTKDLLFREKEFKGENKKNKEGKNEGDTDKTLVWYDGIGADLWFATDDLDPVKDKDYYRRKQEAIDRLKVYFTDIEKKVLGNESGIEILKLHWASKAFKPEELGRENRWGSKQAALDYLKKVWNIGIEEKETSDWRELIKVDPHLEELAREAGNRWAELEARLDVLDPETRNSQLRALRVLQKVRKNLHLLKVESNSDLKMFWEKHKGVLTDILGIRLPDGV